MAGGFVDTAGRRTTGEGQQQATPAGVGAATACLELHGNGQGGPVVFEIQLTVNPNTYPFAVLAGSIRGGICQVPGTAWEVFSSSFGPTLAIQARRNPLGNQALVATATLVVDSSCSQTISISGTFQPPGSYTGVYGFDGATSDFVHTTLFKGWQACS
jgi:hypothetical protein